MQRYKKLFMFDDLNGWTLFTAIEKLIGPKEPYKFQLDDNIVVFNCIDYTTSSFDLKDEEVIHLLNLSYNTTDQIVILENLENESD